MGRKTTACSTFLDQALVAMVIEQHGVVGLGQVCELGLSASAVRDRVASGRLHRIHQGVYSLVPRRLLTRDGLYLAAALACGPGAVISHRSAAALHELRPWGTTKVEVTVPARSARRHDGIRVHRSVTLNQPADTTRVRNIPCTTVARTLLDLAEVLGRRSLERAFDQAEILDAFDLMTITEQLERNPTRHGAGLIKAILAEHYIGSTPTVSELEEAFLALSRAVALPRPEVNAWIDPGDGGRPLEVDFVWRAARIALETDGRRTHDTHQARQRDPRRDQRLMLAGWTPVRTTWRQVTRRPRELVEIFGVLLRAPTGGE